MADYPAQEFIDQALERTGFKRSVVEFLWDEFLEDPNSKDFFEYKNPGFSAADNPKSVQTAIDDTAFVINKFITYFNQLAESEINDAG